MGTADALLRAPLSLRDVLVPRLSSLRCAARNVVLRLREIPRRRDRRDGSSEDRKSTYLRPLDGGLRDAERRHEISAACAVADHGGHRFWIRARHAGGIPEILRG